MTLLRRASGAGALVRTVGRVALGGMVLTLVLSGCGGAHPSPPVTRPSSSVVLSNTTWHCRSRVDLALVRITLHGQAMDAVHLDRGCQGTIGRLEVVGDGGRVGPGGDAVKVHDGAHDLRILGGTIDCGEKAPRKHQDAIQAM
ncbi:MAG TPA: hypothetical protein VIY73_06215, partial [Polyangiaceae bacterium]